MKQELTELGEIRQSHAVGYFNIPFLAADRKAQVGGIKNIKDLNNFINYYILLTIKEYYTQQLHNAHFIQFRGSR